MKSLAEIEDSLVEQYARTGADNDDIAAILGISVALLTEIFAKNLHHARAERRLSLLRTIWEVAKGGSISLLVWLGKVELGWAERAKRGKITPHPKPEQPFDFDSFSNEFASVHVDGKLADEATLRRFALTSIRHELESNENQPPFVDSCTTSAPSPKSS